MATVPQNAIRDLEKYVVTIKDGLDMFPVIAELNTYIFQGRNLEAVVRAACKDSENLPQVTSHITEILNFLYRDCETTVSKCTPNGISDALFKDLKLLVEIVYETSRAMQVDEKIIDDDISKLLIDVKEMLKKAFAISKESQPWTTINRRVLEFVMDITLQSNSPVPGLNEPSMYAREDGVVSSIAFEKAQLDTAAKKANFSKKLVKILNNFMSKNPDDSTMREIVKNETNFSIDGIEADELCTEFLRVWDIVLDGIDLNKPSQLLFFAVLKKFFLILANEKRNLLASHLYDNYKRFGDVLPNSEKFIENYQQGLNEAINRIPIDHQRVNADPASFQGIQDEILWYLFVTPVSTFHQLLAACVRNKNIVPSVVKICRGLPSLFSRKFVITDPNQTENVPEYLIIVTLRKLLHIGKKIWTTSEEFDNFAFTAVSFSKNRKRGDENDVPLLQSYDLISFAITQLFNCPPKVKEIMTKVLHRMLANNTNNRMLANYKFSTTFNKENSDGNTISAFELLNLLYDLLIQHDGTNPDVAEYCRETIKAIGRRLKDDDLRFDSTATAYLVEKCFNQSGWWVKYSIFAWFDTALGNPRRQVPSGIYLALDESEKEKFEQIKTGDQAAGAECYLRSFFELGLFDVELAIELLHKGYEVQLNDVNALEKISLALVDCYGKRFAKRQGGKEITKLLKEMISIFDPSRSFKKLEVWSSWMFEAVKEIDHLMVLSKAAKIAVEKKLSAPFRAITGSSERAFDEHFDYGTIADQLVDIYCESAKELIDNEICELKELQDVTRKVIFGSHDHNQEGWKLKIKLERKEQKLIHQMTMLFTDSVSFTRILKNVPIKLKNLLVGIVTETNSLQISSTNRSLDDAITETHRKEMVYSFANSITISERPKTPEAPEPPAKPSASSEKVGGGGEKPAAAVAPQPSNEQPRQQSQNTNTSVTNPMFQSGPKPALPHYPQNKSYQSSQNRPSVDQRPSSSSHGNEEARQNSHNAPPQTSSYNQRMPSKQRDSSSGQRVAQRQNSRNRNVYDPHTLTPRDRQTFNQGALQRGSNRGNGRGGSRGGGARHDWQNERRRKNSYASHENDWRHHSDEESDGNYERYKENAVREFDSYAYNDDDDDYRRASSMANGGGSMGRGSRPMARNSGGSRSESERSTFNETHKATKVLDRNGKIPHLLHMMEERPEYPNRSSTSQFTRGGRSGRGQY